MFSEIAPRYDLLNHLLSFSMDRPWRWRTARRFRHILSRPDARVLDLCCGTADLTLALHKERTKALAEGAGDARAAILGSDFAHPMLVRADRKSAGRALRYVEADATKLPFADASFDLITNAFGFRNLANYEAGLREMHRILRPGGEFGVLEFSAPEGSLFSKLYRLYFTQVVPRVGGAVSGSSTAYSYLPVSVSKFPSPPGLRALAERVGFVNATSEFWMFGAVALHRATKK